MGKVNKTALLSGALIGIGVAANSFISEKYVGAMLFSLALLAIIKCGAQLYTGQIGYAFTKRFSFFEYISMLFLNLAGVVIAITVILYSSGGTANINILKEIATTKFSYSAIELMAKGAMCGMLIFIAVYCKSTVITIFCIMTFILCGYEHCIAMFPFLIVNVSWMNIIKFLSVVVGNSLGSIITYYALNGEA